MTEGATNWGWILAFGLVGICTIPIAVFIWPRMWRGEYAQATLEPVPKGWVWGRVLWHAWVRAWFVSTWICVVSIFLLPIGVDRTPPAWYAFVAISILLTYFALTLSVILFNRPHFRIPRNLRHADGMIFEVARRGRPGITG